MRAQEGRQARGTLCQSRRFGHVAEAEFVPLPAAVIADEGVVRLLNVDVVSHAEHITGCLRRTQGLQGPPAARGAPEQLQVPASTPAPSLHPITRGLLSLVLFTSHHVFEVHPRYSVCQCFILFCG